MKKTISLFIIGVICWGWAVNATLVTQEVPYKEIEVQQNETLWDIASREVDDQTDIRKYIYDIQQANHLSHTDTLLPGQIIKIPD